MSTCANGVMTRNDKRNRQAKFPCYSPQISHFNMFEPTQERFFVYNCSNIKIYSLFDISAIVFNDCSFEIQQKHRLVGSSRQLVLIKALFYNGCTMS